MDLKLKVVVVPVRDVDKAKQFYLAGLGSRLDADFSGDGGYRIVQVSWKAQDACPGIRTAAPPGGREECAPTIW
jgi:catechol 2,3-dioxygenase-like lactoylglutathione lyase family enzyme